MFAHINVGRAFLSSLGSVRALRRVSSSAASSFAGTAAAAAAAEASAALGPVPRRAHGVLAAEGGDGAAAVDFIVCEDEAARCAAIL